MKKNANSTFGIIGLGRFGTALAITLAEAGKEVIVVDQNEEKVKAMRQHTEYAFVCDNLSKATLSEVGIQNCDTVIVCIGYQYPDHPERGFSGCAPRDFQGHQSGSGRCSGENRRGGGLSGAGYGHPSGQEAPVRKLPGFHFPGQ